MIEQHVVVSGVQVDWNTVLQNSRHDRVHRGRYDFLLKIVEKRTVAGLKGFAGRMNGFLDRWLVEVGHEFVLRWCSAACVVDVVETEAAIFRQILLPSHLENPDSPRLLV